MRLYAYLNLFAIIEASLPTTKPSASISIHFFSISAGVAENVFIAEFLVTTRGTELNTVSKVDTETTAYSQHQKQIFFIYKTMRYISGIYIPHIFTAALADQASNSLSQ